MCMSSVVAQVCVCVWGVGGMGGGGGGGTIFCRPSPARGRCGRTGVHEASLGLQSVTCSSPLHPHQPPLPPPPQPTSTTRTIGGGLLEAVFKNAPLLSHGHIVDHHLEPSHRRWAWKEEAGGGEGSGGEWCWGTHARSSSGVCSSRQAGLSSKCAAVPHLVVSQVLVNSFRHHSVLCALLLQ